MKTDWSDDGFLLDGTLCAVALCGCLFVVRLILAPPAPPRTASGPTVAVVQDAQNEVRWRAKEAFEWHPVEAGDELHAGDLVFVGPRSFAHLTLTPKTLLAIDENSLLAMPEVSAAEAPALTLVKGAVDVKSQERPLTVERGKTRVQLQNDSSARLSAAGQGAEVEVKSGGASVGSEKLGADTRTRTDPSGKAAPAERLSVALSDPSDGARAYSLDEDPRVTFVWTPPAASADCGLLLRAEGRPEKRVLAGQETSLSLALAPAHYTWRVECTVAGGPATAGTAPGGTGRASSQTRSLHVEARPAPRLLSPREGNVVDISQAKAVAFNWTQPLGAKRYLVTVSSDEPGMPDDEQQLQSPTPRLRMPIPNHEGRYCAQVQAQWENGPDSLLSPRECFRLVLQPVLKAPQLFAPKREHMDEPPKKDKGTFLFWLIGSVAYAAEAPDSAITLRWESIAGARLYLLEIAEDRAFARVVLREKVDKPYYRWPKIARKNYYWRVRGIDAYAREGVVSDTRLIGVEAEAPLPQAPKKGTALLYERELPEIELRWAGSEVFTGYIVVIAKDAELRQVVERREVKKLARMSFKPGELGEYFWRVQGVDLEGQLSQQSPLMSFSVGPAAPDPLRPKEREAVGMEVELAWSKRPVGAYELELLSPDGNEERKTSASATLRVSLDQTGVWSWRVRGRKPDTPWSERKSFTAKERPESVPTTEPVLPASAPASTPVAVASAPVEAATEPTSAPAERPNLRFLLGPRLGFFYNFGAVATVRPGADVSVRAPLGPGELGGIVAIDYYPAGVSLRDAATGLNVQSSLQALNLSVAAVYALSFGQFRPYASLGLQVTPMFAEARLDGKSVAQAALTSVGGVLAPGCELALGPGAAYLELVFAVASRPRTSQFQLDGSGMFIALGYRFQPLAFRERSER